MKSKELEHSLQELITLIEEKYCNNKEQNSRFLSYLIVTSQGILNEFSHVRDAFELAANEVQLEEHVFDLRRTILNTIEIISMTTLNERLAIRLHQDNNLPEEVKGDLQKFKQIFSAFLEFATKVAGEGAIDVSVYTQKADEVHQNVSVEISLGESPVNELFLTSFAAQALFSQRNSDHELYSELKQSILTYG